MICRPCSIGGDLNALIWSDEYETPLGFQQTVEILHTLCGNTCDCQHRTGYIPSVVKGIEIEARRQTARQDAGENSESP